MGRIEDGKMDDGEDIEWGGGMMEDVEDRENVGWEEWRMEDGE